MTRQFRQGTFAFCLALLLAFLPLYFASAEKSYGTSDSESAESDFGHDTPCDTTSGVNQARPLKGVISMSENSKGSSLIGHEVDGLLSVACERDPQMTKLDRAVAHFRTRTAKIAAGAKDDADFVICFRGFGPSSEASDVITGEKVKIKSEGSAAYARQKQVDGMHLRIVSSLMQIAMGLGVDDATRSQETVNSGVDSLRSLVGDERANQTLQTMAGWNRRIKVPEEVFRQPVRDVQRRNEISSEVVKTALARDPVVTEIQNHLHKYNHLSTATRVSGRICSTALGVLARSPVAHHAGLAMQVGYVTATGGPEQAKIMKELYLNQRLNSRKQVLTEETHMAVDNHQLAVVTHNPCLLACSELVVQDLAGPLAVSQCFGPIPQVGAANQKIVKPLTKPICYAKGGI
jgi:hypothetical protein